MMPATCRHGSLVTDVSQHGSDSGFVRPSAQTLLADVTAQSKASGTPPQPESFPAPLALPDDCLSVDPKYPKQSFRSWRNLNHRNEVSSKRKTIYVAGPPSCDPAASFVQDWVTPTKEAVQEQDTYLRSPHVQQVMHYLSAFYHGMPAKLLDPNILQFRCWEEGSAQASRRGKSSNYPSLIGLKALNEMIGIRTRKYKDEVFPRQLNLNDLLDAAISVLPEDAYALLLVVDHDLYEDEEDDFACGRAYGGSRVAVVSSARYHPGLDDIENVERDHAWPASHCADYVNSCCNPDAKRKPKRKKGSAQKSGRTAPSEKDSPLRAAVKAHSALRSLSKEESADVLNGLWFGRVCRTASHELGHCVGMDHCIYYACSMQGTTCLAEDARQPMYLCPIDDAKVERATGKSMEERYRVMLDFCNEEQIQKTHVFAAYGAWLKARLKELDGVVVEGSQANPIELD